MLICERGKQLGEKTAREALGIAEERQLQLLEVAKKATPPVWKLVHTIEVKRAQPVSGPKQKKVQKEKELRFTDRTEEHDLMHKVKLARGFLEKGIVVKLAVLNTGRVQGKLSRAEHVLQQVAEQCEDVGSLGNLAGARNSRVDENTDAKNPILGVVSGYLTPLAKSPTI
ncbi:MAG: hypothetical protein SGPRY_012457 [Prymnesium sp.]